MQGGERLPCPKIKPLPGERGRQGFFVNVVIASSAPGCCRLR